ncbi:hypothetical protein EIL50_02880 [bacterium NHP-B]|nr:hypothetical protein EIL50_02880 [bacterium NHP-B]
MKKNSLKVQLFFFFSFMLAVQNAFATRDRFELPNPDEPILNMIICTHNGDDAMRARRRLCEEHHHPDFDVKISCIVWGEYESTRTLFEKMSFVLKEHSDISWIRLTVDNQDTVDRIENKMNLFRKTRDVFIETTQKTNICRLFRELRDDMLIRPPDSPCIQHQKPHHPLLRTAQLSRQERLHSCSPILEDDEEEAFLDEACALTSKTQLAKEDGDQTLEKSRESVAITIPDEPDIDNTSSCSRTSSFRGERQPSRPCLIPDYRKRNFLSRAATLFQRRTSSTKSYPSAASGGAGRLTKKRLSVVSGLPHPQMFLPRSMVRDIPDMCSVVSKTPAEVPATNWLSLIQKYGERSQSRWVFSSDFLQKRFWQHVRTVELYDLGYPVSHALFPLFEHATHLWIDNKGALPLDDEEVLCFKNFQALSFLKLSYDPKLYVSSYEAVTHLYPGLNAEITPRKVICGPLFSKIIDGETPIPADHHPLLFDNSRIASKLEERTQKIFATIPCKSRYVQVEFFGPNHLTAIDFAGMPVTSNFFESLLQAQISKTLDAVTGWDERLCWSNKFVALEWLDLSGSNINDSAVLSNLQQLRFIRINDTAFSNVKDFSVLPHLDQIEYKLSIQSFAGWLNANKDYLHLSLMNFFKVKHNLYPVVAVAGTVGLFFANASIRAWMISEIGRLYKEDTCDDA